ncbi:DUF819 family protein [Vibrio mediterranei]|uniref:DUF819 family protein n=1 Tax=Vibrio mediterranei TaxID=689 RepID=UPI0022845750|nr:DUF819 family protein [Vibrio mediterranei]MCY9855142.1 DUF819 family protein [Vibrio mediterranei]
MIQSTSYLCTTMFIIVGAIFYAQRFSVARTLGPALLSIISGIVLSNSGILPQWHDVYGVVISSVLPLSLALFMLSINLADIKRLSGKPLLAMTISIGTVSVMGSIGALVFHDKIPEIYKFTGMFIGTYTGGSANLAAVGVAVNASPEQLAQANGADYIVGMPVLILFYLIPRLIIQSSHFSTWYPYQLKLNHPDHKKESLFKKIEWSISDIAILMALAFSLVTLSDWIAQFVSKDLQKTVMILTLTTLALILGQFQVIKKLKGSVDLGIYLYAFFLLVIGSLVDIQKFFSGIPSVAAYCGWVIFGSLIVYIIICRLIKIPLEYLVIAYVASIADGTTSAVVAASNQWRSLISLAILLGMIGATIGSYIGIAIAWQVYNLG